MAKVRVYRSQSGDTWDLISFRVYGTEGYFHNLIRANLNLIDIAVFSANIPIIVPDFVDKTSEENYDKLPPWKR